MAANLKGQVVTIEHSDVPELLIRFNDEMVNMDKDVSIVYESKVLFKGKIARSKEVLTKTFRERRDRTNTFTAEVKVRLAP